MSGEVEAAALASAGGWFRRRRPPPARPPGAPCANCAAVLAGPWCHECGQLAEDFHRSVGRLMREALEGLTHFDGRFWSTMPRLALGPGALTRDYIDGHRAAQIPPLRLFLVVLLLVFVCGGISAGAGRIHTHYVAIDGSPLTREQAAQKMMTDARLRIGGVEYPSVANWLKTRAAAAFRDPRRFEMALESQGERFAFLSLPLATLLLSLLFAFKKGVYVFDHTIFALHSLSFQGLLLSVVLLFGDDSDAAILLLAAPVHLFFHMRAAYRIGVLATLARMTFLALGSAVGFLCLLAGLLFAGLNAMGD